jgi:hypothetical protein
VADIPAEAVEAAAQEWYAIDAGENFDEMPSRLDEADPTTQTAYRYATSEILAAALPHLRAQWLAEVQAALRDDEGFAWWAHEHDSDEALYVDLEPAIDYLGDVLGAGAGGEG